jgi:hypothetical protein
MLMDALNPEVAFAALLSVFLWVITGSHRQLKATCVMALMLIWYAWIPVVLQPELPSTAATLWLGEEVALREVGVHDAHVVVRVERGDERVARLLDCLEVARRDEAGGASLERRARDRGVRFWTGCNQPAHPERIVLANCGF